MATKRTSKRGRAKASARAKSAPITFVGFSATQIDSLRAAKRAAAQRLLQPAQSTTFSALAASTWRFSCPIHSRARWCARWPASIGSSDMSATGAAFC